MVWVWHVFEIGMAKLLDPSKWLWLDMHQHVSPYQPKVLKQITLNIIFTILATLFKFVAGDSIEPKI